MLFDFPEERISSTLWRKPANTHGITVLKNMLLGTELKFLDFGWQMPKKVVVPILLNRLSKMALGN